MAPLVKLTNADKFVCLPPDHKPTFDYYVRVFRSDGAAHRPCGRHLCDAQRSRASSVFRSTCHFGADCCRAAHHASIRPNHLSPSHDRADGLAWIRPASRVGIAMCRRRFSSSHAEWTTQQASTQARPATRLVFRTSILRGCDDGSARRVARAVRIDRRHRLTTFFRGPAGVSACTSTSPSNR